ncbi:MAG: isoaspartyl peptidase/L-asparaginase, partial [Gemmatimonadetes bacterium]|nr:isoaspartyl peptidase/L-asparaginase [Gemmatimonadota bacterium]
MTAEHELDSPRRVDAASGLVVRIDDLDAHFEQAVAAGARIESEPRHEQRLSAEAGQPSLAQARPMTKVHPWAYGPRSSLTSCEGIEMSELISRRDFVLGGGGLTAAALVPGAAIGKAPAVHTRRAARPVVIASANGHRYRNGGTLTCVETAFAALMGGQDVLDALISGVNIVELDPDDTSVGYGGLPNAEGVVQLDASCMHGPTRRAGAVAALEGVRTPSRVAKAVMENTDHHLLVGQDAQRFARQMGFAIEEDLNTPRSRALWLEWKRRTDPAHFPDPASRAEAGHRAGLEMVAEGLIEPEHYYGTINCNGVNARGDVCGVTTTSGLAWKIPGRVGDSPILGAGLYVDGVVGAAGSTGRGEANLYTLTSFLI